MTIEKARMQKEIRKERLDRQKMGEEFITETIYLSYAEPAEVEKMLRASSAGAAGTTRREDFYQNLEKSLRSHGIMH